MSNLSEMLAQLSATSPDGVDDTMHATTTNESGIIECPVEFFNDNDDGDDESLSSSNQKRNVFSELQKRREILSGFAKDAMADTLDGFLDDIDDVGDVELRDSLIEMGRKYHRDNASNANVSEISKMYSGAEKKFRALYTEASEDRQNIQRDIDQMRMARSRNFKALSELVSAKKAYYEVQVGILKELNRMTKDAYDLKTKEAQRQREESSGDSFLKSNAIHDLFAAVGRGGMIDAMGGYESISGAGNTMYEKDYGEYVPPEISNAEETDGDGFLKYEDSGAEMVLILDENGKPTSVIAEDSDGNILPDYPIPDDISKLHFNINKNGASATDDYYRSYKVRYE